MSRVWTVVALLAVVLSIVPSVIAQQPIHYIYDDLGRLVGVVDPAADTAVYSYDAVGNLLSIARFASTTVSIITFSPGSGPVGATVTISGTGFSVTPSQNAVTFNGTAATVSTATATRLVTTVPVGASTGAIAVTSPSGSATSATAFTVTTTSGAPTISGLSPAVGAPGAATPVPAPGPFPLPVPLPPVFIPGTPENQRFANATLQALGQLWVTLSGAVKGDDPGFRDEDERRRRIEEAEAVLRDPNSTQREKSQAKKRIRELSRRKSKRAHGADTAQFQALPIQAVPFETTPLSLPPRLGCRKACD
jgi:YD repeat-containing protein